MHKEFTFNLHDNIDKLHKLEVLLRQLKKQLESVACWVPTYLVTFCGDDSNE